MKNKIKFLGIIAIVAVIGFSFISCEDEEKYEVETTEGKLDINGLAEFNGKSVIAYGRYDGKIPSLAAYKDISAKGVVTYAKIENGRAELNVWECDPSRHNFTYYKGNNEQVSFSVVCYETEDDDGGLIGYVTVTFLNGLGSGNFIKK